MSNVETESSQGSMPDYCVVGGGPAGLTAALQLCRAGKSVTLIDENDTLGGCHRVIRTADNLFSEHSPRIYSGAYLNTASLLDSMGSSFDEQFTPYKFSVSSIGGGGILHHLSVPEMLWLAWAFLTWSDEQAKAVSVADYMAAHDFSGEAREYINRLCLLTDGAAADTYSLWQFLQLVNQQALYTLYQPRRPTDQGLFALWRAELLKSNCTLIQGRVFSIRLAWSGDHPWYVKFKVPGSKEETRELRAGRGVIVALPPASALGLFQDMHLPNLLPETKSPSQTGGDSDLRSVPNEAPPVLLSLAAWVRATQYATYIPVSLHFDHALPESVSRVHGFPATEWGIAFVVLSDYFEADTSSPGLISTAITLPNAVSSHTNLSANQTSTEAQVVAEVIRQLRQQLPGLPEPTKAFITPGVTHKNGRWHNPNTSYVAAAATQPWGPETEMPKVYSLGTHNGRSAYSFTSMESAVSNALALTNELEPASARPLLSPWSLKPGLLWAVIGLLALLLLAALLK